MCARFSVRCVFHGSLSVRQALFTLIRADVLVTSGSSFPALAAIYSNGLVLYSQNKDAFCPCYAMRNYFQLSENGTLTERDELRLIAVAHEVFRKKFRNVVVKRMTCETMVYIAVTDRGGEVNETSAVWC
jgi:hypothetical protein